MRYVMITWLLIAFWYVGTEWPRIQALALGDTDDNMRLMQVRALLNGQDWYDLRNYYLNPPGGFDIHWSRIVDLPIAGLILLLRPFVGTPEAERLACGIAPLLPLSIAFLGLGATARRLIGKHAWPLALALMAFACTSTMLMFAPERIDHHGWQLAMLSLTVAGLSDPKRARGGAIVGAASAVSLSIGLEMMPYVAMAGAIITLQWIWDREEAPRVEGYALSLGGGTALGYAAFGSYANSVMRCDALTPVYLTVMIVAGALLFAMARLNPSSRWVRLGLAVAAGAVIVAGFALLFPQCLGRPEQVSPELAKNWLNNVREAKPVYTHPFRTAFPIVTLPLIGLLGAFIAAKRAIDERASNTVGWTAVALFTLFACLMLLWQTRAAPGAQMLAVPGAAALIWIAVPLTLGSGNMLVRVFGTVAVVIFASGAFAAWSIQYLPIDKPDKRAQAVNNASARCPSYNAMIALNRYPPGTMFSFVDLGPRIIVVSHHKAVAGPYHRNGDAILDVQHAFGRSPDEFRAIAAKHGAAYLLVCPNMAESTIYRARNPGGFYDRLAKGETFAFLTPLPLPKNSPLRLFRIN
ncbi:AcrB/AcrD/AcrF family protein [Sphingomonas panacisoli]|uniref:AcrB/AcrD/AcrF family protein n=1 Tax=Sphingomonas panacisoli TaxID=1813879 RepID=A0A5B8LMZ2_9SPHN|nr:AcrB/AcrD/AcrF family protein [Sphingomonas panacisoli]QDZ08984.1 AcrB/AcrD/AcrF family protein [Sphingomonas panacisoli]